MIFQCSKNYGSPTSVTMLKVAPNMADPISINYSVGSLNPLKFNRFTLFLYRLNDHGVPYTANGISWFGTTPP